MENLKLIRKEKKKSNRQSQREREMQGSTSVRMSSYAQGTGEIYDHYLDYANNSSSNQEGTLIH